MSSSDESVSSRTSELPGLRRIGVATRGKFVHSADAQGSAVNRAGCVFDSLRLAFKRLKRCNRRRRFSSCVEVVVCVIGGGTPVEEGSGDSIDISTSSRCWGVSRCD